MSVCLCVRLTVCHTLVLYQNEQSCSAAVLTQRISFKLAVMVYHCTRELGPAYLASVLYYYYYYYYYKYSLIQWKLINSIKTVIVFTISIRTISIQTRSSAIAGRPCDAKLYQG